MDATTVWKAILTELELSLSKTYFAGYIKPLTLIALEKGDERTILTLLCPTPYHSQMLEDRYGRFIVSAAERLLDTKCVLRYEIGKDNSGDKSGSTMPLFSPPQKNNITQGSGIHNLNPRLIFDTYIVGSSNNFAYAAGQGVAKNPGLRYNPLFIYGGVGLGKTHLMHAIGHAIYTDHPDWDILYISAETFGSDLIASLKAKRTDSFKKKYRAPNVLLIDDIQFIAGKEYIQEEFFHTFNQLYLSQRQIILTSDKPPQEIQGLEERLVSRFMGGITVDVQIPDYETRVAILTQKCETLGIEAPIEALSLLAERPVSSIRELEGALTSLLARANSRGSEMNAALVQEQLGTMDERRTQHIRPQTVINKTAHYFEYKTGDLTGKSRKSPLTTARHVAMYLLYQELNVPYEQIGELLGGRDHTTAMHGVEKISTLIQADPKMAKIVTDIKLTLL